MKNTTPKTITQCQIIHMTSSLIVAHGLGKQTFDPKITFEKFTYPCHRPYFPSLSFSLDMFQMIDAILLFSINFSATTSAPDIHQSLRG